MLNVSHKKQWGQRKADAQNGMTPPPTPTEASSKTPKKPAKKGK